MLEHEPKKDEDTDEHQGHQRLGFSEADLIPVPSHTKEKLDDAALSKEIDTLLSNLDFSDVE